tara:strand:- start:26 stop:1465 length:1440 start_codon:yes stop_codon:yes gene_type:complete
MALGSISIEQQPVQTSDKVPVITNWTPIVPYTIKQTEITGLFYFKFVLEIRLDDATGTLLGRLKQRQNGYTTGTTDVYTTFDIRNIVNTQIEKTYADQNATAYPIHTLGANTGATTKIYSKNSNQVKKVFVKAYQSYASSATIVPSFDDSPNATDTLYYIAASLPLQTARTTGAYFQGTAFQTYQMQNVNSKFLSDLQPTFCEETNSTIIRTHIQDGDYHTLAFLNGVDLFNGAVQKITVKYYNADGTANGSPSSFTNSSTAGGAVSDSGATISLAEHLLYFGCGVANLEGYDDGGSNAHRPSNHSGWAYYTIQATNTNGAVFRSALYYFIKQTASCKGFKSRRLAWTNSKGGYDYFTFNMKSTQTLDVTRNTYGKLIGDFNSTEYSYQNYESSKKVREVQATLSETLNTDYITEEDAQLLENLIMSTDVFMVQNADTDFTVPVMVTDNKIVRKTGANNKVKIQYTIKIEYSNPINTNS